MIEMQFYLKQCIKEGWKVRELKRQMKSCLFQRIALSTDKEGVLNLAPMIILLWVLYLVLEKTNF